MLKEIRKLQEIMEHVSQNLFQPRSSTAAARLAPNHYQAVGIGYKNGDPKAGLALRYYVRRKLPESMLPPSELINGFLHGIVTDVAEIRPFGGYALAATDAGKVSQPGAGVQFQSQAAQGPMGTLGAVVVGADGRQYALGANHVLSRNGSVAKLAGFSVVDTTDPGSVVFRPVPIGAKVSFAPLYDGCSADCAIVEPGTGVSFKPTLPTGGPGKLTTNVTDPIAGRPAAKFGFSTQWTRGIVADHTANIRLDCGAGLGVITINDVALVQDVDGHDGVASFAAPGDSGAVVFQEDDNGDWSPCGLVVGGPSPDARLNTKTEDYIAVCRLSAVLDALNQALYPGQPGKAGGLKLQEFEVM